MVSLPTLVLLIARHNGHDEAPSISYTNTAMTGFVRPTGTHTTYYPAVLNNTSALTSRTASAMLPGSRHSGYRAPYANVTSTELLKYGTVPSSTASSPVTSAWEALWSLHWPASSATNSSAAATTTTITVINSSVSAISTAVTPAVPFLTSRPVQPSSTTHTNTSITTVSAVTLSSMQNAFVDPGMFDPIIFDPGRLSSPDAQTSTIHITVTASVPKVTPTTTMVKESIITSQVTSTLTKTLKPSPFIQSASVPSSVSPSSAPQSSAPPNSSSPQQSGDAVLRTSIVSRDPRCPYPFPGVYCGDPKTILITETRSGKATTISAPTIKDVEDRPKESGSCPYPGMKC